jgi:uncharacterized damage-inducible protein DinB
VTNDEGSQVAPVPVERHFGWSNLFVPPEEDPRSQIPSIGEKATLTDFLTAYRHTLELKCQGLDAEQLARRSVPPSNLSLLGLIRHLSDVERYWFREVLSAEKAPRRYRTVDDRDGDFSGASADPAIVSDAWARWREEVANSDRCLEAFQDLGVTVPLVTRWSKRLDPATGDVEISVREILVHMIEEYARHCGHADLLRERIDGRVGQ